MEHLPLGDHSFAMYLFGCCARKHDDADREGSLLSPKVEAGNQPRRSKRSKKPHYGLVSQGGQTLPLETSTRGLEVHVAPGEYEGGNYCLALILPESAAGVSVSDGGQDEDGGGRAGHGEFSVSSSVQLLDDDSDAGIIEEDNVVAAEEEVCFSKSSDGSRWSTLCEASNGSSARELRDGSVVSSSGCVGRKVVCESPDTGISWSYPDITSSEEHGFDSPRARLSGTASREGKAIGDNSVVSDVGEVPPPSHGLPIGDPSEYTADCCAPIQNDTVAEFMSHTCSVQENVFAGTGEKFSNDVVRVTQYVLETINRVCDSFETNSVEYIEEQESVYTEDQEPAYFEDKEPVHSEDQEPVYFKDQAPVYFNDQEPAYVGVQAPGYSEEQKPIYFEEHEPIECQETLTKITKAVDNFPDSELFIAKWSKGTAENLSDESDDLIYSEDPVDYSEQSSCTMNVETDKSKDYDCAMKRNAETSIEFTSSTEPRVENYSNFDNTVENNGKNNRVVCDDVERMQLVYTEEIDSYLNKSLEDGKVQQRYAFCDSKCEIEDVDDDYERLVYTSQGEITSEAPFDLGDNDHGNRTVNTGNIADGIANFHTASCQEDEYLELIADRFVREVLKSSLKEKDSTIVEPLMSPGMDRSSQNSMILRGGGDDEWHCVSEDTAHEESLLAANEQHRTITAEVRHEFTTDGLNISQMELHNISKERHNSEENRSPAEELANGNDECISKMQPLINERNLQDEQPVTINGGVVLENKILFIGAQADEEQLHTVNEEIPEEEMDVVCKEISPEEQSVSSEELPYSEELALVNLFAANYVSGFIMASVGEVMIVRKDKEADGSNLGLCRDALEDSKAVDLFELADDRNVLLHQCHDYETLLEFNENLLLLPPAGYCGEETQESTKEGSDENCQEQESLGDMVNSFELLDLGLQDVSKSWQHSEVLSDPCFPSHSADAIESSTERMSEDDFIPPVEVDESTELASIFGEQAGSPDQFIETSVEADCLENETLRTKELFWSNTEASKPDRFNQVDQVIEAEAEHAEYLDSSTPLDDGYCSLSCVESTITTSSEGHDGLSVDEDSNNSITCLSKSDVAADDARDEIIVYLNGNNNLDTQLAESEEYLVTDKSSEQTMTSSSVPSEPIDNVPSAEAAVEDLVNANVLNLSNISNEVLVVSAVENKIPSGCESSDLSPDDANTADDETRPEIRPLDENKTVDKIPAGCESSELRQDDANTADEETADSNKPDIKNSDVGVERVVNTNDAETRRSEHPAATSSTPERRHGKTRFIRTKVEEEDIFTLPSHSFWSMKRCEQQHTVAASPSRNLSADYFSAYIIDLSKDLDGDSITATSISAGKPDTTSCDKSSASNSRLVDDMLLLSPDSCLDLANFAEMEDSAQRPPIVRRSISLKTSPTGTPRKKKAVRFADALGLDLESVRHIRSNDDLSTVPTSALPQDSHVQTMTSSSVPPHYLYMEFSQPRSRQDFLCRVYDQKVSLESCVCDDKDLVIAGCIRVYNISFRKEVVVRYTTNGWVTYRDTPASYLPNSSDGTTDQFSFTIVLPSYFDVGSRLEFAIWYRAGDDLSQSHWDNNQDANYCVDCYSNCNGGSNDSPAWLHFL